MGIADEIPSITNYYDGSEKLNTIKVECRIHTNALDCLHQAGCGWCGANSACIRGNQLGPMEACAHSTYVFTTGALHPEQRVVKENVGALSMTILQN
jgi:positive regulator of sigma E activity